MPRGCYMKQTLQNRFPRRWLLLAFVLNFAIAAAALLPYMIRDGGLLLSICCATSFTEVRSAGLIAGEPSAGSLLLSLHDANTNAAKPIAASLELNTFISI